MLKSLYQKPVKTQFNLNLRKKTQVHRKESPNKSNTEISTSVGLKFKPQTDNLLVYVCN